MKVLTVLAIINIAVAAVSALASAAPLPGALLLFALWVPLAAFFAANHQTVAALCVPLLALLAFAVSPLHVNHATIYLVAGWGVWVFFWSLAVLYFSRVKLRTALSAHLERYTAMKPHAILSDVPSESAINAQLSGAYFHDCYVISVHDTTPTALNYFLTALANTPSWVNSLMALRNKIVGFVGLKNLGDLGALNLSKPASAYAPGDRVGIFTLISNSPNEVLLGDCDKHLDVVLSVYKHPLDPSGVQSVSVTTVVHIHNLLGRIYMFPVTPLHRLIAPAVLNRIIGGKNAV